MFGVVYLDSDGALEQAAAWADLDGIIAWDRDAETIGAPQNVQVLHQLLDITSRVWYRGGLETVHTAELIVGLGCEKVIVDKGFFKTDRSPEHFVRRLGGACVPVIHDTHGLEVSTAAGAEYGLFEHAQIAGAARDVLKVVLTTDGTAGDFSKFYGVALLP